MHQLIQEFTSNPLYGCHIDDGCFRAHFTAITTASATTNEDLQQRKLAKRVWHGFFFTLKLQTHYDA
jgi:hypothetical protein